MWTKLMVIQTLGMKVKKNKNCFSRTMGDRSEVPVLHCADCVRSCVGKPAAASGTGPYINRMFL